MTLSTAEAVLSLYSWGWKRTLSLKIHCKFNKVSHKSIRILTVALSDSLPVHKVQVCINTDGCNFKWPFFPPDWCAFNWMGSLWSSARLNFHWFQYAGPFKMYWHSYFPCQTSPREWPLRQTSCKYRTAEHRNSCLEGDILRLCKFTVPSIQVFSTVSVFFNTCFSKSLNPVYRTVFREPELDCQSQSPG